MRNNKTINIRQSKFKIIFILFLFSLLIPHHPYFVFSIIIAFGATEGFVEFILPGLEPELDFNVIKNNFITGLFLLTFFSNYFIFQYHFIASFVLACCMSFTTKELMKIF